MNERVYHMLPLAAWRAHLAAGGERWAPPGFAREGFVHLSTAEQLAESMSLHSDPSQELWLFELDSAALGEALRWEASRGGALFPHLHRELEHGEVRRAWRIPRCARGSRERWLPALGSADEVPGALTGAPALEDC